MFFANIILQASLLWLFITYFTRATNNRETQRQAIIVTLIMVMANLLVGFLLRPLIGGFSSLVSVVILYFVVSFICQTPRRTTLWITGAYFVAALLIGLLFSMLSA